MLLILNLLTVRYDFILLSVFSIKAKNYYVACEIKIFHTSALYIPICMYSIIIYLVNDKNNNLFDVGSLDSEK